MTNKRRSTESTVYTLLVIKIIIIIIIINIIIIIITIITAGIKTHLEETQTLLPGGDLRGDLEVLEVPLKPFPRGNLRLLPLKKSQKSGLLRTSRARADPSPRAFHPPRSVSAPR